MSIVLSVLGGVIIGAFTSSLRSTSSVHLARTNLFVAKNTVGVVWSRVLPIYAIAGGLIAAGALLR